MESRRKDGLSVLSAASVRVVAGLSVEKDATATQ